MKFIKYNLENSIYLYLFLLIWEASALVLSNDNTTILIMSITTVFFFLLNLGLTYRGFKKLNE